MLRVLHTCWTISHAIFLFRHLQSQVLSQRQVWYLYFSYIYPFSAHCFKKYHLYSIIKNISWLIESSNHVQHTTVASTPITFVLKNSQPREQEHSMEMHYEFWFVPEREREKIERWLNPNQTKPNVWSPLQILNLSYIINLGKHASVKRARLKYHRS